MNHIFRLRFAIAGGHVHCRLFIAAGPNQTFALCGTFVVRKGTEFRALVKALSAEFFKDDECSTIDEACVP